MQTNMCVAPGFPSATKGAGPEVKEKPLPQLNCASTHPPACLRARHASPAGREPLRVVTCTAAAAARAGGPAGVAWLLQCTAGPWAAHR